MPDDLVRGLKESRGLLQGGRIREAMARLMHLTEKYPDDTDVRGLIAEALNKRGVAYAEAGDLERALSDFQRSTGYQDSAPAHVNLGRLHMGQGHTDSAFQEFTAALELDEDYPEAHEYLGHYFVDQGDFEQAAAAFGRAIAKGGETKSAFLGLWESYVGLERKEQAHEVAEEVARRLPQDDEAFSNLGLSWAVCKGDYEKAEAAWRKSVELNPKSHSSLFNLAGLAALRGRRDEAMDWLKKCVAVDRDRTLALWKEDIHAAKQKFAAYAGDEDFLDILGAITSE